MLNHVHFLNDGNPTTATATCIQRGCLFKKRKLMVLLFDDRAAAVRPSHCRIHVQVHTVCQHDKSYDRHGSALWTKKSCKFCNKC